MKRLLFLLLLLFPGYLFAQSDSLSVLGTSESVDEIQEETPPALTWNDRREPLLAGFLSYLMPGLGQVYNKQYEKAFGIVTVMTFSAVLGYQSGVTEDESGAAAAIIGMVGTWAYSLFDAISTAKKVNRSIELQLGKNASLSLKPDFRFNRNGLIPSLSRPEPMLGLKLNLSL